MGAASLLPLGHGACRYPTAWAWRWTPLDPDDANFDATVNQAWNTMKARSTSLAIGRRDAAYMRWRFVERPDRKHRFSC